jgi:hypothetical protein
MPDFMSGIHDLKKHFDLMPDQSFRLSGTKESWISATSAGVTELDADMLPSKGKRLYAIQTQLMVQV